MADPINIIGNRYGYLTVVERAENNKRGNTQWLCRCDCGNEKVCLGYDLTHGRTVSCGCSIQKRDKPSPKRVSLVGNRYGKLTVVSLNEDLSHNGILVWNCRCDCGNTFTARGGNLKCGKATHCGCSKSEHANNFIDLTGKQFGHLTAIKIVSHENKKYKWLCECDCGNQVVCDGTSLRGGKRKTCGDRKNHCVTIDYTKPRKRNSSKPQKPKKVYQAWLSMRFRCSDKYHGAKNYYDKGIRVCDEWQDFKTFEKWALSHGFNEDLSLDRIDNDKGYFPENCRWVTMKAQENNRSNNVKVVVNGVEKTLKQWSEYYNVPYQAVRARRKRGWPTERLFEPLHKNQYQ